MRQVIPFLVSNADAAEQTLSNCLNEKLTAVYIVTSDLDADINDYWCPDCRVGIPIIKSQCDDLKADIPVYECFVGDRIRWRSGGNPYRRSRLLMCNPSIAVGCEGRCGGSKAR